MSDSLSVDAIIGGAPAKCLVDTGAQVSVVSKSFWQIIPNQPPLTVGAWPHIQTVSGESMRSSGVVHLEITFKRQVYSCEALVVAGFNYDIVLGLNFLNENQAIIDLKSRQLFLDSSITPSEPTLSKPLKPKEVSPILVEGLKDMPYYCSTVETKSPATKTSVIETIALPPCVSQLVEIQVSQDIEVGTLVLIEPSVAGNADIIGIPSLVQIPDDHVVSVGLTNLLEDPITLWKDQNVADVDIAPQVVNEETPQEFSSEPLPSLAGLSSGDQPFPSPTQKGIDNDTLKLLQELVNSKKMPAVAATEPNNFSKHEDFNAESVQGAISDLYNKINNLQATARNSFTTNQNYSSRGPRTFDGTYQQHSSWYEPSGYYGEHQQVPGQDRRPPWKSGSFRTPNRFNYSRRGAGRGNSSGFRTRDGQVICSTCEGVGHYARSCPNWSSGPSSRPQNSQNSQQNLACRGHGNFRGNQRPNPDFSDRNYHVNVVTWAPEDTDCAQTGAQLLGGMASGTQEPLQVKCLVNSVPTESLVDTGSQITVVSKDFWQKLPDGLRPPISKEGYSAIKTVSGQILNPIGSAFFQFEIMNSLFNFRAFILPELEQQAILGLDFLKASKFTIDFVHNTIKIPSQLKGTTYNSKNSSFWTPQGRPICFRCKKAGHTVKFCFQRSKVKRPLYRIPSSMPQRSATLRQHKIPVIATISASDRPTKCEGVTSSVSKPLDFSPRDMILHKHKFNKNPSSHLLLTAVTICAITAFLLLVSKVGLVNANEVANTQSRKSCLPVRLSDDRCLVRGYQLSMDPRNISR